jgi:enoyl-CoA hydratase/carnithine racemase
LHQQEIEQRTTATRFTELYQQLICQVSTHGSIKPQYLKSEVRLPVQLLFIANGKTVNRLSLADCFRQELTLSVQCARHPDFIEGVRALLVDKDQNHIGSLQPLRANRRLWLDEHYQPLWPKHPLADL